MDKKYNEELLKGFTPDRVMEEASRCLLCIDAPCSKDCPAGTSPDKFIRSVRFRNFKGAAETIRHNNALGSICARVCPTESYCQKGCIRSGLDVPIDIGRIQRFATDLEASLNMQILQPGESNGKKIAIVGSGPSGLQAAATLRTLGYEVTIYEKENMPGGYLRCGIPKYRLPDDVLNLEIKRILDLGVKLNLNINIGEDITVEQLKKENDAVIIAVGYSKGKILPMFKDNKHTVVAVDYLKCIKLNDDTKGVKSALVIGGGDVAMDVVSSLKLKGVEQVLNVVYEQMNEFRASHAEKAVAFELANSVICGFMPIAVNENEVTFKHRFLDSELKLKADLIVLAVGQEGDVANLGVSLVNNEVDGDYYKTTDPKIFYCGDIAHMDKTVVAAVRTGKEVAYVIEGALGGK